MKTCPDCNYQNENNSAFCVSCGTSFENKKANSEVNENQQPTRKKVKKGKFNLPIALVIVLVIFLFTGYQLLDKKYSDEVVEEQFKTALVEKDKTSLKELIQPNDSRLKVNDDSLDALFTLIDNEPSIVQDIIDDLHNYGPNVGLFSLQKDGKHFGIFDRYVIGAEGYFLLLTNTSSEETTFHLNDKEIGTLSKDEDVKEIGPLLAGSYHIKATSDENGEQGEDMTTVNLSSLDTKMEVALDTEIINSEEEEEIFTWAEYEGHNFYILPGSDTYYLNESDLSGMSKMELRIARNEIFARYGYIFNSQTLQNYFDQQEWYWPNPSYDGNLNDVETHNVDLIKSLE